MELFFNFIQRFGRVLPEDVEVLREFAHEGSICAGDYFLKPGQECRLVGFILEGVVRVYVVDDDNREITRGFPAEYQFMVDLESYYHRQPSSEYWEAITEVKYIYWERADIDKMRARLRCWEAILVPLAQHILVSGAHERSEMFSDSAAVRYSKFINRYPRIVTRVPLRLIANYLGIAPQSLSRIRQQLVKGETPKI